MRYKKEHYTTVKGGHLASFAIFTKEMVVEMYGSENVQSAENVVNLGHPESATTPRHILNKVTQNQAFLARQCMQKELLSPVYWDDNDEQLK